MVNWLKMHFIPHEGNGHRPHILHQQNTHRIIGFVIFIEVFAFLIPSIAFIGKADSPILPSVLSELTNKQRIEQHLAPLTINPLLNAAAQAKANDMAANSYFAHTSPAGKTPWYWIEQAGYRYSYAGENLAINFIDSQDVTNAWMNSPEHRANILKANYTEVGTGVAEGMYQGYDTIFVAQDFGSPITVPVNTQSQTPIKSTTTQVKNTKKILGAETSIPAKVMTTVTPETAVVEVQPQQSVAAAPIVQPTIFQQLAASPRNTTNVFLFIILGFVTLAVVLNVGIKISHHHPDLILNGVMVIAIIGCVFVINNYIGKTNTMVIQSVDYTADHTLL